VPARCSRHPPLIFFAGPEKPELLIITCGSGWMYSLEAVANLGLKERVGILKLGTTWPLPEQMVLNYLQQDRPRPLRRGGEPFLENNVKELFAQNCVDLGVKRFQERPPAPFRTSVNLTRILSSKQYRISLRYPLSRGLLNTRSGPGRFQASLYRNGHLASAPDVLTGRPTGRSRTP